MNQIKKRLKETVLRTLFFLPAAFLTCFFSCGIDEYFYLPQVPESNITRSGNTEAQIIIPQIISNYATNYSIFYRIYISDYNAPGAISQSERTLISPTLVSDYNAFFSITDPASTSLPNLNTFIIRNYFELEFDGAETGEILSKNGKTLRILFQTMPGEIPVAILDNDTESQGIRLRRSRKLISPEPINDPYFRNTSELSNFEIANKDDKNADVAGRSGISEHAYVSMYIVAVGVNNNFAQIFSKPTHVGIFKLPNM